MGLKRQKRPEKPPSPGCAGAQNKEKGSCRPRPAGAAAAVGYVSVDDADALDCGVCYLPLKPPIFQELSPSNKPSPGSALACGFVGSTDYGHAPGPLHQGTQLALCHQGQGCHHRLRDDDDCEFNVSLCYGFNFLIADCATDDGTTDDGLYLFLLNVAQKPLSCCISVLCIHPQHDQAPPREMQCELSYSRRVPVKSRHGGQKLIKHYQESTFAVGCTDLSSGLPKPDECFPV